MDLVTGATGSLGMHIAACLLREGRTVRGLVRSASDRSRTEDFLHRHVPATLDRWDWLEGDVEDGSTLDDALSAGVERVFHAAAVVSFHPSDAAAMMAVNRDGTANLVDAMLHAGVKRLVHISSVAALGRKPHEPVTEETPFEDGPEVSTYGRSKHLAEREAFRGAAEGLDVVVLNPVVILGEGDYSRSSAALFDLVARGLNWYPSGENGFVGAWDVARAAARLGDSPIVEERFLLCAENRSYETILSSMARALGKPAPKRKLKGWMMGTAWRLFAIAEFFGARKAAITKESVAGTSQVHHYNSRKLEEALGDWSYTPIDQVIAETAAAYLSASNPRPRT